SQLQRELVQKKIVECSNRGQGCDSVTSSACIDFSGPSVRISTMHIMDGRMQTMAASSAVPSGGRKCRVVPQAV
ncbi:hypothetical protein PMAYCL1PPCAC_03159, partial [Pristionchus mayeri]